MLTSHFTSIAKTVAVAIVKLAIGFRDWIGQFAGEVTNSANRNSIHGSHGKTQGVGVG